MATTASSKDRTTRSKKVKPAIIEAIKAKKETERQAAKSRHVKDLVQASMTLAATASKQAAIEACIAKVDAIVAECLENNCRFRDATFDLLNDKTACVINSASTWDWALYKIDGAKRVGELFKRPVFFLDGVSPDDLKQGAIGNCWHIAALAVISNIPGLLEQICVKRNEKVGVYGFIFFRDGDWISTVVDDQLFYERDSITNKTSLVYAECKDPRETWLPLMEKAYAKIHGDYKSLEGGFTGDGIEDLTGGVCNILFTSDILDVDLFWNEEMLQVNKTILMGCSINFEDGSRGRTGVIAGHAYSVLEAVEYKGERLVHLRNPWGKVEWNGDWSDDSEKWTPEAIETLKAYNKDDGRFWMSYDDFLKTWTTLDRVRVFDDSWHVSTTWMPYHVEPRSSGKFSLKLTEPSKVVLAMCQPDTRYFAEKQSYLYKLAFHVYDANHKLVKRAKVTVPFTFRGVNCEVHLQPGVYTVVPKVTREPLAVEEEEKSEGGETTPEDDAAAEAAKTAEALFAAKKAKIALEMAKARLRGKTLVGVDDVDELEPEDKEKTDDKDDLDRWELILGLRVYSHDSSMTLEAIPGDHPVKKEEKKDEKDEKEGEEDKDKTKDKADEESDSWETDAEDPEEVTPTRKDKKDKKKKKKAGKKVNGFAKEE